MAALSDEEIMNFMDEYENRQLTDDEMMNMMDDFERKEPLYSLEKYTNCYRKIYIDGNIELTIAGQQSQVPGSINVLQNDEWCGRIINGRFKPYTKVSSAITNKLSVSLYNYEHSFISYKSEALRNIYMMLERVGHKLKHPCIHFKDFELCFSQSAGVVYIHDGFITQDGTFTTRSSASRTEISRLEKFGQNPAKTARDYGRLTGKCCFCNRELTDEKSTNVGYGPICAKRYQLPY